MHLTVEHINKTIYVRDYHDGKWLGPYRLTKYHPYCSHPYEANQRVWRYARLAED